MLLPTYVSQSASAILSNAEEKKCKYLSAAELRHASFAPFVVSVDGTLGHEALMLLQRLADRSYSHALAWIKVHLALLLLFGQPTFAFVDHVCVGKVELVLMMELASLIMFHWSKFCTLV